MLNTIFAKKVEMVQRYTPDGERIGVTVLSVPVMNVTGIKLKDKNGYSAAIIEIKNRKAKGKNIIREVRTEEMPEVGTEVKLEEMIKTGDVVRVTGVSRGHGFAGVVKRHGFAGGPRTHGQSDRERAPGSSGQTTTPGRVLKGKRMAGRMGNQRVTVKNLKVVEVDLEKKLISVKGSVPGSEFGLLEVRKI